MSTQDRPSNKQTQERTGSLPMHHGGMVWDDLVGRLTASASGVEMRDWMCTLWDWATVLCSRSPSVCRFSWQFSKVCFAVLSDCLGAFSTLLAASLWKMLACASQRPDSASKQMLRAEDVLVRLMKCLQKGASMHFAAVVYQQVLPRSRD